MNYIILAPEWYLRNDGRLHLGNATAIQLPNGIWHYSTGVPLLPPDTALQEIVDALTEAGPGRSVYRITPLHALVLYPHFITGDDLRRMQPEVPDEGFAYYLEAMLPFGDKQYISNIVVDPYQNEPLIVK
jgi:hypothetical protein